MIGITGANGQLGQSLLRLLPDGTRPFSRAELDITDPEQVVSVLNSLLLKVLINCAAYTQVDQAEKDQEACRLVNVTGVHNLANACERKGVLFVQISSDYVFGSDTLRQSPYKESDKVGPLSVYGQSKFVSEEMASKSTKHLIIRTCGLYGASLSGKNFVESMLRLGKRDGKVSVVNDQHCTPSFTDHVSRGTLDLINCKANGLYHVVNTGQTTWFEFAKEIFCQSKMDVVVEPISTEQFAAPAARPFYSVLSTKKQTDLTGKSLPTWQEGLAEYLANRDKDNQI